MAVPSVGHSQHEMLSVLSYKGPQLGVPRVPPQGMQWVPNSLIPHVPDSSSCQLAKEHAPSHIIFISSVGQGHMGYKPVPSHVPCPSSLSLHLAKGHSRYQNIPSQFLVPQPAKRHTRYQCVPSHVPVSYPSASQGTCWVVKYQIPCSMSYFPVTTTGQGTHQVPKCPIPHPMAKFPVPLVGQEML